MLYDVLNLGGVFTQVLLEHRPSTAICPSKQVSLEIHVTMGPGCHGDAHTIAFRLRNGKGGRVLVGTDYHCPRLKLRQRPAHHRVHPPCVYMS